MTCVFFIQKLKRILSYYCILINLSRISKDKSKVLSSSCVFYSILILLGTSILIVLLLK